MMSFRFQPRELVDTAMGRVPADMVIRAGTWVCVQTGEFIESTDIAIKDGRIAYIGSDASHCIQNKTRVIEANGRFLVPGLLDAHLHIESSMLSVTEFVRAVVPHGSTGLFIDPHEIANVFGLEGIRFILEEARQQPIQVWVQMPSCVPSSPEFEKSGAHLSPSEVKEALSWEGMIGLGEVMDYQGVANGDTRMLEELMDARQLGKVIGGHYASQDFGKLFHGYVAGGVDDDHEGSTKEGAIERARQGLKVMVRYGSAWQDVIEQIKAITEKGLDSRHFLLCTDDTHAETLHMEGHMDRVIRHAIQAGLSPMTAIQMATINTAEHFGLTREIGMLAPGRLANIVLVSDLNQFHADTVIVNGSVAAEKGDPLFARPISTIPHSLVNSINVSRKLISDDFRIRVDERLAKDNKVIANVIGIVENQAVTNHLRFKVELHSDEIQADVKNDVIKLALVERHLKEHKLKLGLVHGFGLDSLCAIATTVAHDSHQMLVIGTDDASMAEAANYLVEIQGGQVVVKNGQVIGEVDLPIAGLMSSESASVVAGKAKSILDGFKDCGCKVINPNMLMSLLALVVIPELRLSEQGLIDVDQMKIIPVFEQAENKRFRK